MQASPVENVEPIAPGHPRVRSIAGARVEEQTARPSPKSRYRIREVGGARFLTCVEAPTLRVRVERGVTASAQEARRAAPGTIFLDGAAQGPPFMDPVERVYNLDHHEGCVRAFTLSTCEQAMVLISRGLQFRDREWTLHANDADLDVVLAIWVLLNHLRLSDPAAAVRAEVMPLLRLEGAIDALGLDLQDLCALPPALLEKTRRRMDRLLDHERNLRATNSWHRIDPLEYIRERLTQIDGLVYPESVAEEVVDIEELGRAEIAEGSVVVACRARAGIYEVERELRRLHGPRLGLIALKQRSGVYTLRQVNPALRGSLDAAYEHLNLIDSAAGSPNIGNRWGGSQEIGGSPRESGTKLSVQQVLDGCRHAYAPTSFGRRLTGVVASIWTTGVVLLLSLVAAIAAEWMLGMSAHAAFGYALAAIAGLALIARARRSRCVFGLRMPHGLMWLWAVPVAIVGAFVGGTGLTTLSVGTSNPLVSPEAALPWIAAIIGTEFLFRGLAHGQLVWAFGPTQRISSAATTRGMSSVGLSPALLVAVLSSGVGLVSGSQGPELVSSPDQVPQLLIVGTGALLLGWASGVARESSGSVLAAIVVSAAAAFAVAFVGL